MLFVSKNILDLIHKRHKQRKWFFSGVQLRSQIKYHIKHNLKFTKFGVDNFYDGIEDMINYSIKRGKYKCNFMNMYDKFGYHYDIGGIVFSNYKLAFLVMNDPVWIVWLSVESKIEKTI